MLWHFKFVLSTLILILILILIHNISSSVNRTLNLYTSTRYGHRIARKATNRSSCAGTVYVSMLLLAPAEGWGHIFFCHAGQKLTWLQQKFTNFQVAWSHEDCSDEDRAGDIPDRDWWDMIWLMSHFLRWRSSFFPTSLATKIYLLL